MAQSCEQDRDDGKSKKIYNNNNHSLSARKTSQPFGLVVVHQ